MTSKTSFFNKAIYKSNIKRFCLGSALYFILLFLSSGLNVILSIDPSHPERYGSFYENIPLILRNDMIILPLLIAVGVTTIVSVLIFRFCHHRNQAVFMHSLPVSRKANYISTLLAGLTLMIIPVILNGIILMIISLCGYGRFFSINDCLIWTGINLFTIFTMFSVSVFSAVITGNPFGAIAVNALIHGFSFILVSGFEIVSGVFLYGFYGMEGIYDRLIQNNFAGYSFSLCNFAFRENVKFLKITELMILALAIYTAGYFLYRKRRIETASDVAGFKCLNAIFKYSVAFLGTLFVFAVFSHNVENSIVAFFVILLISSAVFYFGLEMLLKKTFKVGYSYKGYILFAAAFAIMIYIFAGTGFFGYEKRVPEVDDVKAVTAISYYNMPDYLPASSDTELIKAVTDFHRNVIGRGIPMINSHIEGNYAVIRLKYQLKNGMTLERRYYVPEIDNMELMNTLYENEDYKKQCEMIFIDDSLITNVYITYGEQPMVNKEEFLEIIRKETLNLSYSEINEQETSEYNYGIRIEYKIPGDNISESYVSGRYLRLNKNYTETLKWLEEKGYKPV